MTIGSERNDAGLPTSPDEAGGNCSSRLIDRREVAERTIAVRFVRPPGFRFTAGQFMEVTLPDPPETDAEGDTRPFSIASPPDEDALMVVTRIRDTAFKRSLASMLPGAPVTLAGSFGDLILHADATRPAVLLTGGIGITPFHSILLDAAQRRLRHSIFLFYSNRRPEDAPFLDELHALGATRPSIRFIPTMTRMEKSQRPWHGETGPIDWEMLVRHSAVADRAIYYIAGPPTMVRGLQAMLAEARIPKENVRTEEFDGY
jgi:ferredoxin-NADP reductase